MLEEKRSPKFMSLKRSRKFADAGECVTGILSLPKVCLGHTVRGGLIRKVVAWELVSLDGVMEKPEEWSFSYSNDEMAEANAAGMAASDAMLLGRVTYEEFAAFWPYQNSAEQPFTDYLTNTPKYVVSTTLQEPLEWQNSTLIKGNVAEEIAKLKRQPGKDITILGSGALVQSLLQDDLLDELRLMVHPIVVGSGKRLFEVGTNQKALRLVDSKTFTIGVLYLTYQPAHS
jgi:dihydrofolate reductase